MIHRAEDRQFYTIVDGRPINDAELSTEALGLLVRMLSLNEEWEFSIEGLITRFGIGRKTLLRNIKELKARGYLEINQAKNEAGKFSTREWHLYEISRSSKNGNTENGNTEIGNTEFGNTKNGTLTNINITNINKTNIKGTNNNKDDFEKLLQPLSPELKETFLEFIKMRKTIKAPMTAKALDLAIKKAEKLGEGDPDKMKAVIEQSIMNSWKGLFALKEPDRAKPAPIKTGNEFLDLLNEWGGTE